jgi:hypothetical protein
MALTYAVRRHSKTGKGLPQVEQLDDEGKPILDKDGKPVIGNEQFTCNELTEDSIAFDSVEAFETDVMETINGDLEKAAECFRVGWNRITRLEAGGMDEYQKAARGLMKLKLPAFKGLTFDEVVEKVKALS